MSSTQGSNKRQRTKGCSVRLTDQEQKTLKKNAALFGLPMAHFMRDVSLGVKVQTRDTKKAIADLGRLGGLFKLAITKDQFAAWRPEFKNILLLIQEAVRKLETTDDSKSH